MAEDHSTRLPPQDLDAEAAVLGCILLDPNSADLVAQTLRPEQFYRKANSIIYGVLLEMRNSNQAVDQIILKGELQRRGLLDEVGGAPYIAEVVDSVGSAGNAEYYARVITEKATLRALVSITAQIQGEVFSAYGSTEELLDSAEKRIFEITQKRIVNAACPISEAVQEVFDNIRRIQGGMNRRGIMSGLGVLDEKLGGFQPGELTILAARPSMGKTSLALSFLRHICVAGGHPAVLFSLEMPKWQVASNLLCNIARIDSKALRGAFFRGDEERKLIDSAELLNTAQMFIDDSPSLSTMELRAKARRLKAQHNIEAIIIDYLQLMTGSGLSAKDGRQFEVSEISRMLKALARELEIPVVALAQLSRKVEDRPDHKPRMSDLRESGSIEQDADVILLLYRAEYYKPEDENLRGKAQIICAKNRNGPTGDVEVRFESEYTRFDNLNISERN